MTTASPDSDEKSPETSEDPIHHARDEGAKELMGPGFLEEVQKLHSKKLAFSFWYHPYTELAIFALIVLSVVLLIIEVTLPTGQPVGWMGGLATGTVTGWFFWADIIITALLAAEYFSKLWIAPKGRRWFFVRNTWIELISLLPVLRIFRLFRVFRTLRIFRLMRVLRTVRLMRSGDLMARVLRGYSSDIAENRAGNLIIATYFVAAMLFGTVGILIFEKGADSQLDTMSEALWWCVVTLSTVGYGDVVPQTPGGRIVAGMVMVLGLGFWSVMIGVFTTSLVRRARKKETIGLDILGIRDHIVIFGWTENALRMVRDYYSREAIGHLVVVTEQEDLGLSLDTRFHHLCADPTDESTLDRVHIENAHTVVALAESLPHIDEVDVDARTLMACLAARSVNPSLRLVVELLDEKNVRHARAIGADDIVVTQNYAGALMSQSVQSPGVNRAYQELFDIGRGGHFAEIGLDEACRGLPFSEAAQYLLERRSVSLIGFRRNRSLIIAPDDDPILDGDDRAIVVESHPSAYDEATVAATESTPLPSQDMAPREHVLVCGWSREAHRMVADLYAVAPELTVTVICNAATEALSTLPDSPQVEHVQADPTSEAALYRAGIEEARAVVIVADRLHGGSSQTLDARTILIALTVRQLSPQLHLIAELRNENNLPLATHVGVDEWLFADQFSGTMLSQSLQSTGLSQLFTALFETGAGSALAERRMPAQFVGCTFGDSITQLLTDLPGAPIGVRRQSSLYLPPDAQLQIEEEDRLIFIYRID